MDKLLSVIIPNHNGAATIGKCLEAVCSSRFGSFEVIVVDDCSTDNSVDVIRKFPCTLVQLTEHSGASKARNTGARRAGGEILFFTDADCVVREDTLSSAAEAIAGRENVVVGGTYTRLPYDSGFFSSFQSVFVNYSETKKGHPDYIATHAMAVGSRLFKKSGGFSEDFLPILEDVEFSHRLRRSGYRLEMQPHILVRHIFNFTLSRSLRNAFRKSLFWTQYSLGNRDLFGDSGTASAGLKANVACFLVSALLFPFFLVSGRSIFLGALACVFAADAFLNRGLIAAFYRSKGFPFALAASMYYMMLYPLAVGAGALTGALRHFLPEAKR
ncbi:MAG: glycosyltransferase family 2 protein [Nitrospirae bacterium]|nr:glycosyltransferase family 2 protein [Nitrospirota bacterium]